MYTPGQLTSGLASQNREALVSRLTHYDPNSSVSTKDLSLVNAASTEMTLQKLMTLSRPEIYMNPDVYNIEERLGICRPGSRRHKSMMAKSGSAPSSLAQTTPGSTVGSTEDSAQRWFKDGGGFMTAAHKGRCSLDPKLISINTPGAGRPSVTQSKKSVPGMGFSASTSSRDLDPIKMAKLPIKSKAERAPAISRMEGPQNMISTGARYGPLSWQSTELSKSGMTLGMSVHAGNDKDFSRASPGPAYNSAQSDGAVFKAQGGVGFAHTQRFAPGMNSHVAPSSSPGPIYNPGLTQTAKALPMGHTFSARLEHGAIYEEPFAVCSPGPSYNPRDVANGYTDVAAIRAHSFGRNQEQSSMHQMDIEKREKQLQGITYGGPGGLGGRGKRGQRRRNQPQGGGAVFEAMKAELQQSLDAQKDQFAGSTKARHRELLYL